MVSKQGWFHMLPTRNLFSDCSSECIFSDLFGRSRSCSVILSESDTIATSYNIFLIISLYYFFQSILE
jgi:hypothetical protein